MIRKNQRPSDLVTWLKDIVQRWPKSVAEDVQASRDALHGYLAEDFDSIDLLNHVKSVALIEGIDSTDRRVAISFFDTDQQLQRAVFELSNSDVWRLKSLKFQCRVCFGSGVNDGDKCSMCGGSGWGVSS